MGTNVETIDILRFADYIAVITDKEEDLQNILRIIIFTMKNKNINKAKTKDLGKYP